MKRLIVLISIVLSMVLMTGAVKGPRVGPGGQGLVVGMPSDVGRRGADAGRDTLNFVFVTNESVSHGSADFTAAVAAADDVFELGTEVPEFAWGMIDASSSNTTFDTTVGGLYYFRNFTRSGTGDGALPVWDSATANQGIRMVYVDWASYLPKGHIISADVHEYVDTSFGVSGRDTLVAVLMTSAGDASWATSRGLTGVSDPKLYLSHATWDYKISGLNTKGYPASNTAWSPLPSARDKYTDWGDVADFSGLVSAPANATFTKHSIRNCVQASINGTTQYGIALIGMEKATTTQQYLTTNWEASQAGATLLPWVQIKMITKRYKSPLPGGAEFAFVFSTDGLDKDSNEAYADSFEAYGGSFTITLNEGSIGGVGEFTWSELFSGPFEQGMEIASHGMYGNVPASVYAYAKGNTPQWSMTRSPLNYVRGMDPRTLPAASSSWDSLLHDTDPIFLHNGAVTAGYPDGLVDSPRVGKAFTFFSNAWSAYVLQAMKYHGYTGYRGLYNYNASTNQNLGYGLDVGGELKLFDLPTVLPAGAVCDSIEGGFDPNDRLKPRNVRGVKSTIETIRLVGNLAATPTKEEVQARVRSHIRKIKAQGTVLFGMYSHGSKSVATSHGINPQEVGWSLEVVYDEGGVAMGLSAYANAMASAGTAIDTPAAFSISDSLSFDAADEIWYQPDGMDGTLVPGLK